MAKPNLLDRVIGAVAPARGLQRLQARAQLERVAARMNYEGAAHGRRTDGWRRPLLAADAALSPRVMNDLRGISHDLVRNNAWAAKAVTVIADHVVGAGIIPTVVGPDGKPIAELNALARQWFDSKACDAQGRVNFYRQQYVACRGMVTSGGSLLRRRWRRAADGLPLPMQLQLMEIEYVDMNLANGLPGGGYRLGGVDFDALGRRTAYNMYIGHPGSVIPGMQATRPVPASEIAHVYRDDRAESVHGQPWFAPIIVRSKDWNDAVDARIMQQKVAAAFAAFRSGDPEADPAVDGNGEPVANAGPEQFHLEPGAIFDLPPGGDVKFPTPPSIDGYRDLFTVTGLELAAGIGIPYEALTGDNSQVSFISGRLGRLYFKRSIEAWQYGVFIPMFCEPAGDWFLEAAQLAGHNVPPGTRVNWTPPAFELMDPASEISAEIAAVRAGFRSRSSVIRRFGDDADMVHGELLADAQAADRDGLVFDTDPRRVTQAGNGVIIPNADERTPQ
ncbi:MAG: phage portal protein [Alphaproteobacteria bacterium]|nr:phage portal protein [Alphaproteobacteria bacterium]